MSVWVQGASVALATMALFFGTNALVARVLRLRGLQAQLVSVVVRLALAVLLALGLALSGLEHRVALVFTVGATYFADALIDGVLKFRKREAHGCSTR